MSGDFFDPTPEQQVVVLVESATLRQAERLIESCEHCNDEGAQIPLDKGTGHEKGLVKGPELNSEVSCPLRDHLRPTQQRCQQFPFGAHFFETNASVLHQELVESNVHRPGLPDFANDL